MTKYSTWRALCVSFYMFFALLFSSHGLAQSKESLEKTLRQIMGDLKLPGLAAAVLVKGEVLYLDALGLANLEHNQPMTPDTLINVGSVSKLITSSALMLLVEKGKVDLDSDVSQFLPFPVKHPSGKPITSRQLLTHSSGILDSEAYSASYACGDPTVTLEAWLRGYLLPDGKYYSPANFSDWVPGTNSDYSNVAYGLIGLMVEHVSKTPFQEFTKKFIQQPLGMHHSGWSLAAVDRNQHATPYWLVTEGDVLEESDQKLLPPGPHATGELMPICLYSFYNYPDGLFRTSLRDLLAFVRATYPNAKSSPLLTEPTRELVFQNQLANIPATKRKQGLGWRLYETKAFGTFWGHGGSDPGILAKIAYRPSDDITLIFFANADAEKGTSTLQGALFSFAEQVIEKSKSAKDP